MPEHEDHIDELGVDEWDRGEVAERYREDAEERRDEAEGEARDLMDQAQQQQAALAQAGQQGEQLLEGDELEQLQNQRAENPAEVVADDRPAPALDAAALEVENALQNNRQLNDQNRKYSCWKFMCGLVGFIGGLGSSTGLYFLIKDIINGAHPGDVDPVLLDEAKKLADLYQNVPASCFWPVMATFVDNHPEFTIADQLLFMQYIVDLGPITPFVWDSNDDKVAIINQIVDHYQLPASYISDVYNYGSTIQYKEQEIPRVVLAGLIQLALGEILRRQLPVKRKLHVSDLQ